MVSDIVVLGERVPYNSDHPAIAAGVELGWFTQVAGFVRISNDELLQRLAAYVVTMEDPWSGRFMGVLQEDLSPFGRLDTEQMLRRFAATVREHFPATLRENSSFLEGQGRLLFLKYLTPLVSGQGSYRIVSSSLDRRRMDLLVTYSRDTLLISLRNLYGASKPEDAHAFFVQELAEEGLKRGYLMNLDLRPLANRSPKEEWLTVAGRQVYDVVL